MSRTGSNLQGKGFFFLYIYHALSRQDFCVCVCFVLLFIFSHSQSCAVSLG